MKSKKSVKYRARVHNKANSSKKDLRKKKVRIERKNSTKTISKETSPKKSKAYLKKRFGKIDNRVIKNKNNKVKPGALKHRKKEKKQNVQKRRKAMQKKPAPENAAAATNQVQTNTTSTAQQANSQIETHSDVEALQKEYSDINSYLVQRRKAGVDTFIQELKLFSIPSKIQLLKAEYSKDYADKIRVQLNEIREELEKAEPQPTPLDLPKVQPNQPNPFSEQQLTSQNNNHPLTQDAENYSKELAEKRLSNKIKNSLRNASKKVMSIFKKGGGN
ncbi:MAG: hypothetical protein QW471_04110 [Candidatus Woesearchaeota archaeon]